MFQQTTKYNVQMTNIFLRFSNLEIKNKHIIKEKDKFVQNMQGALEKEQKLKVKLQDRNSENSQILEELQVATQNINNMEKHSKDLENIKIERVSLQATLKDKDANYQGLKAKKDTLSIKHTLLEICHFATVLCNWFSVACDTCN